MGFGVVTVSTFTGLDDTPSTYSAQALKLARVNAAEDALEFGTATQYQIPTNIVPDQVSVEYTTDGHGNYVRRMRVVGKYLFIAEQRSTDGRTRLYDISNPESPDLLYTYDVAGEDAHNDVFVVGKYVFVVSNTGNSILIADWSDPRSWTHLKTFEEANINAPKAVFIRGRYMFVASNGNNTLAIYDISDPSNPVYVGHIQNATYLNRPLDVVVSGNYAFVNSLPYLTAVNIADPTSPTITGYVSVNASVGTYWGRMWKVGKYIYVADYNNDRVRIVDVSNPASMSVVGTLTDATNLDMVQDIRAIGDWIFAVAGSGKMCIIDATDITSPSLHETYDFGVDCGSITIAGKYAFLGAGAGQTKLEILSVWSIDIPAFIGNSIYADYIYCENIDVAEQVFARYGLFSGVAIPDALPKLLTIPLVLTQVIATDPGTSYTELRQWAMRQLLVRG